MTQSRQLREVEGEEPLGPEQTSPHEDLRDGELKLTVRKLELPVRPRGVLAE